MSQRGRSSAFAAFALFLRGSYPRLERISIRARRQRGVAALELKFVRIEPLLQSSSLLLARTLYECDPLALAVDFVLREGHIREQKVHASVRDGDGANVLVRCPPVEVTDVQGVLDCGVLNFWAAGEGLAGGDGGCGELLLRVRLLLRRRLLLLLLGRRLLILLLRSRRGLLRLLLRLLLFTGRRQKGSRS